MRRRAIGLLCLAVLAGACGGPSAGPIGAINVVAGENFWGSVALQLGGSKVNVQSVVTDPNADPHLYESSANDARAFADASLVVLNGAGYDAWGQKLLDANPSVHRQVLDVAQMLGLKVGDNPHFWYNPDYVVRVADRITAEYKSIDSANATYFDQRRTDFANALVPYTDEIRNIEQKYSGTPIGATESIFVYMASALGLSLTTPAGFMNAVAEGNDPPTSDVVTFQNQITANQIKVLVYNVQTTTAVTTTVKALAAAHRIPGVGVSETLLPENLTFQDWQLKQLKSLEAALSSTR
ncbi:MAG TPA: zinc ABC transporter substrate-binding protein [Candidatus Dormibacteraeota bacterium]|nr:zinc ABC transporter substrate-binding protein [Candidatus Dormibacteraeota bacterium]